MSRLVILTEYRFQRDPTGAVWGDTQFRPESLSRYRTVFDEIALLGRVESTQHPPDGLVLLSDEPGLSVIPLPDFLGMSGALRHGHRVMRPLLGAVSPTDSLLVRVPTTSGLLLYPHLRRQRRPYAVEVVGDPSEVFAPGVLSPPLRPVVRQLSMRTTRAFCAHATVAIYVTTRTLQQKYPPGRATLAVSAPSAVVPEHRYGTARLRVLGPGDTASVTTVASLEQRYKGIHVLLGAVLDVLSEGVQLTLDVIGDGRLRPDLERQAQELGIAGQVRFLGQLTMDEVYERLAATDLFVLPSLTEGLPKALLEAMAAGCPCLASSVGGVPELLPAQYQVPPGDRSALARVMLRMLRDEQFRTAAVGVNQVTVGRVTGGDAARGREQALVRLREATALWGAGR